MAVKTLICGLSGTGKSRSMKNFMEAGKPVAVVNPVNKPLPFRNNFEMLNGETDSRKIIKFMKETKAKTIVVDDFQYLLAIPYMRRVKESGWDKYNDFAANYFDVIQVCDELPEDVTVYFMTHTETLEDGTETVKLIGKLLREKICIEGLFTIVLKTMVSDGKYYFLTQNSGKDNVKSPEDMFPSFAIDNDLYYVDQKIRNYYNIGDHVSDEEMAEIDEEVKNDEISKEDVGGKKRKSSRKAEAVAETATTTEEKPKARRAKKAELDAERAEVEKENLAKIAESGLGDPNDIDEGGVPFDTVEAPELAEPPKRKNRKVKNEQTEESSAVVSEELPSSEKHSSEEEEENESAPETVEEAADVADAMNAPEETTARRRRRRA